MKIWQDGVIALLAAMGLTWLVWSAVRAVFFSRPAVRCRALALLPARGDGEKLEGQIRSLALLTGGRGEICRVLIVDCGLTAEGQRRCRLLTREEKWVVLCEKDQIARYLP